MFRRAQMPFSTRFEKYDLTCVTGSLPRRVGPSWRKVVRLSLRNGCAASTKAKVIQPARPVIGRSAIGSRMSDPAA